MKIGCWSPALLPVDPRCCALCRRVRTNPAALTCSGYVFCYPCVHEHVAARSSFAAEGCCPVTGQPANLASIRRLFHH